jgi:hypothetical protein
LKLSINKKAFRSKEANSEGPDAILREEKPRVFHFPLDIYVNKIYDSHREITTGLIRFPAVVDVF